MTLQRYTPERLDELALRLLDLACSVRNMTRIARSQGLSDVVVHDRKALEWIARLEQWCQRTETGLEVSVRQARGARRAAGFGRSAAAPK